ncbi:MAG: prepilin-type N-terminal cleavage/methylation domain-containing protein [Planctomycetes bacterium]|nr:prepilin-type N-terminal cleavage/methylation domain-containing protein [Planctomycetota bacterium]
MKGKRAVGYRLSIVGCRPTVVRLPTTDYRLPAPGFTLVEMLVALALVSTIATMVYGSYAAVSRSLDLYGSRTACYERTSLVLRLMARQIRCAYVPILPASPMPPSLQNSVSPALPAAFQADSRDVSGTILSFITTAGFAAGPGTSMGVTRVMYRYDSSVGTLSIWCEPYRYTADDSQEPGPWRPILSGVTRVDLQCYDSRQWQAAWNGTGEKLPQAVKIGLTVLDEKDRAHEFETTVPVASRIATPKQRISTGEGKP